ncbi:MAG: ABC transporter permease [Actinomycetota bacterium]|nr:ABC transporter permease [Actinomycetota bacterium]
MWLITLRDLQWRLRRFLIAGIGAALVFAMTLLMAGLTASFQAEAGRTVDLVDADAWLVRTGVDGVFTTVSFVPGRLAADVAGRPGVIRADPIVVLHHTVRRGSTVLDVNLVGYRPGGLGQPRSVHGRLPSAPDELVADASLGVARGRTLRLAGSTFTVSGTTQGLTINGGQPLLFLRLADAQKLLVQGADVATAVVTRGVPATLPPGIAARTREETRRDLLRPLSGAIDSIRFTEMLLWAVAALVVGSVVYLSALERGRDFAVYKATGWSTKALAGGLAAQAVLLSVGAAVVGAGFAQLLLPLFPLTFTIPLGATLVLPGVAALVGLVACLAGLRRAVGIDPALAFGGQG